MNLSEIKPPKGQVKVQRRVGRGMGSGRGKYSGRGAKGAKSISGYSKMRGFEGGQMPLHRRLPKRGFTNIFKKEWAEVNLADLERLFDAGAAVTPEALVEKGLVRKSRAKLVVVLGQGELNKNLSISVHRFSAVAKQKIEAAGGKAEIIGGQAE